MLLWWLLLCFSEMKSPRHYYEVIVEGNLPSSLAFFPILSNRESFISRRAWEWVMLMFELQYWLWAKLLVVLAHPGSACHLYFDIEFKWQDNPRVDALSTLETFIQVCAESVHSSQFTHHTLSLVASLLCTTWYTSYWANWTISRPPEKSSKWY